MSDFHPKHHENTEANSQPHEMPAAHRASFIPAPKDAPVFSEHAKAAKISMFDPLNRLDPYSARYVESLREGDVLKAPVPAYDEDDNKIPNTIRFEDWTVDTVDNRVAKATATLVNDAGLEVATVQPDVLVKKDNAFEAAIARRLLLKDGLNLNDPALKVIDDNQDNKELE